MYITLIDEEDVRESMELIQARGQQESDVDQICLTIYLPLHSLASESLSRFFRCLRTHLPVTGLELRLMKDQNLTTPVDTAELSKLLQEAPNLHLLEIDALRIVGRNMISLAEALMSQTQLRTVYLNQIEHVELHGNLQPLADALCRLPRLETLEVCQVRFAKDSTVNARALASIARLSKAKALEVMPCPCHDVQEQGLAVTEGLRMNPMLQKLRLMTCTFPKRLMFQDPVIASLGRVLQNNPLCRLQSLELNVCESINLLPLAQALKANRTLTRLLLCWDSPCILANDKNMTALRGVLRDHNYVLERLDMTFRDRHDFDPPVDPQLDFYLRLNRMGRQRLLEENDHIATRADWIKTLSSCEDEDDLSSVYYFLSRNPLLCCDAVRMDSARQKRHYLQEMPMLGSGLLLTNGKRHCFSLR